MKIGVSTSSLFMRANNDECFDIFREIGVDICEVFLTTFSEYNEKYGKLLKSVKGDIEVNSVHVLNTNYEPQLYSRHEKVKADAFYFLEEVMKVARKLEAKYHTFHGVARLKKTPIDMNFDFIGERTAEIIKKAEEYEVLLSYENVHWAYYNYPGFFRELKARCGALKGTLDIKQAVQSGFDYEDYIDDMNKDIVTVHVSDIDDSGKICLPGEGKFNFRRLFSKLSDCGFDGAVLIEVYKESYENYAQLKRSLEYLKDIQEVLNI